VTSRPAVTIAVAGAATDVGKTWVAVGLSEQLRSMGRRVSARKPVQSYTVGTVTTDAHLLGAATGEEPASVCPSHRWYPLAMAPPIAAHRLGLAPIALHDLLDELTWPGDVEFGLVETVGGVRSPMADDADSATFLRSLRPEHVVLVADAALGAINAVRLCAAALAPLDVTVVLNRFDPGDVVHVTNREWLVGRDGLTVVTTVTQCVAAVLRRCSIGPSDPDGRLAG
jgi:dethiobiotin synthetase